MKNVNVALTDLKLLNGDVITVDKMAIIDKNIEALAEGVSQLVSLRVLDTVEVDTGSAEDGKNVASFNALIATLKAKGYMKAHA